MFVLKSTYDKTAKLAKAACISRDLWKRTAEKFQERALRAEGELARRKAHAVSNLKQNRAKALEGVGG